jgi:hypothetical protein
MKKIKKILDKKFELLSEYRKITETALSYSEFEDVLPVIDSRDGVIGELVNLNSELDDVNEHCMALIKNECNFGELTSEEQEIFSLSQRINTLVLNLKAMDLELTQKIQLDKVEVEKQIREQNHGQNAKAARYFRAGMRDEEVEIVRKI